MSEKLYNNLLFQSIFLMSFLILVGLLIPNWLVFVITKAIAYGLVGLGIITLMRGGLVSLAKVLFLELVVIPLDFLAHKPV